MHQSIEPTGGAGVRTVVPVPILAAKKFRNAVFASAGLLLWSNVLIIWAMQQSTSVHSLLFPLCANAVLTGSLMTMLFQRKVMFDVQEYGTEFSRYTAKDLVRKYQHFGLLCCAVLPMVVLICWLTLSHVWLDLSTSRTTCPDTYGGVFHSLTRDGQAIGLLYILTLNAIYIATLVANYFAIFLSFHYIDHLHGQEATAGATS